MDGDSATTRLIHEIKGPLMAIKGLATTSSRRWDDLDDGERREFLALIDGESDRLVHVIEQVSTLLRLDAREYPIDVRAERLVPLVEQALAVEAVSPAVVNLVGVDRGVRARCDPHVVAAILDAAIDNAIRFSPEGSAVTTTILLDGGDVVAEIHDPGPSLPDEDLPRAFEPCAGVRPPGYESLPGAGLSLHLARRLARAQGGDVTLGPASDGGTILTLRLPGERPGDGPESE